MEMVVTPFFSVRPVLEPQAARVKAAAVARPPAMTVRREMEADEEDMVVPFGGPGGPDDGREGSLTVLGPTARMNSSRAV